MALRNAARSLLDCWCHSTHRPASRPPTSAPVPARISAGSVNQRGAFRHQALGPQIVVGRAGALEKHQAVRAAETAEDVRAIAGHQLGIDA
ncbi:hypothetical protein G6F22_017798 [Rhizopus arrhizus]|nr:hypothetical protein G6F22_017798 [Rhizopus arrhizus]